MVGWCLEGQLSRVGRSYRCRLTIEVGLQANAGLHSLVEDIIVLGMNAQLQEHLRIIEIQLRALVVRGVLIVGQEVWQVFELNGLDVVDVVLYFARETADSDGAGEVTRSFEIQTGNQGLNQFFPILTSDIGGSDI